MNSKTRPHIDNTHTRIGGWPDTIYNSFEWLRIQFIRASTLSNRIVINQAKEIDCLQWRRLSFFFSFSLSLFASYLSEFIFFDLNVGLSHFWQFKFMLTFSKSLKNGHQNACVHDDKICIPKLIFTHTQTCMSASACFRFKWMFVDKFKFEFSVSTETIMTRK